MPSLLNTVVTQNYQRMTPQDTYATGAEFSGFGTRPMAAILINIATPVRASMILQDGSTADGSLTAAQGFIPGVVGWKQPYSLFSRIVRTVQGFGEVYVVGQPTATDVILLVSADTLNGADSGNLQGTGYGLLEAAILAEIGKTNKADGTGTNTSSAASVGVTASGTVANKNFFVGATIGTFA
jgi:hypothetical protein